MATNSEPQTMEELVAQEGYKDAVDTDMFVRNWYGSTPEQLQGVKKLRLIQPGSEASEFMPEGFYNLSGYGEIKSPIVVPMQISWTRFFRKGGGLQGEILCRSNTGLTGEGNPGGNCLTCPKARWIDKKPPECNEIFTYDCYLPVEDQYAEFAVFRTGRAIAQLITNIEKFKKFGTFAIQLTADSTDRADGQKYYRPTAEIYKGEDAKVLEFLNSQVATK